MGQCLPCQKHLEVFLIYTSHVLLHVTLTVSCEVGTQTTLAVQMKQRVQRG